MGAETKTFPKQYVNETICGWELTVKTSAAGYDLAIFLIQGELEWTPHYCFSKTYLCGFAADFGYTWSLNSKTYWIHYSLEQHQTSTFNKEKTKEINI